MADGLDRALAVAPAVAIAAAIAGDPALYDPDRRAGRRRLPAGPYRCRMVKLAGKGPATAAAMQVRLDGPCRAGRCRAPDAVDRWPATLSRRPVRSRRCASGVSGHRRWRRDPALPYGRRRDARRGGLSGTDRQGAMAADFALSGFECDAGRRRDRTDRSTRRRRRQHVQVGRVASGDRRPATGGSVAR